MCIGSKVLWLKEEATSIKQHKNNIPLLRDWWKKCWLRDCTKLQNPEEQSPARTWRHDFASPLSQGKICCSLPVLQNCARWWKQRIDVFLEEKKKRNCPYIFRRPFSPGEPTLPAWLDGYEGCLLLNDNGSCRMAPWIACIIKKCQLCLCVCVHKPCDRLSA